MAYARESADKLIEMCKAGYFDPLDVLTNVLVNYMSADEANDFAESEYDVVG